jgi:DNA-binding HxlR family transcriptional regulator
MFKGKRHYNEFLEAGEKVSTSVLGDRLKKLEEMGIISRGEDAVKKSRIRYSLTQKGIDLLPILLEMIIWGGLNDELTESPKEFMEQAIGNREALVKKIREQLIQDHLKQ